MRLCAAGNTTCWTGGRELSHHVKVQAEEYRDDPNMQHSFPCPATNQKYQGLRLPDGRQESTCQRCY